MLGWIGPSRVASCVAGDPGFQIRSWGRGVDAKLATRSAQDTFHSRGRESNMNKLAVIVFNDEKQAYQGSRAIRELDQEGAMRWLRRHHRRDAAAYGVRAPGSGR